MNSLNWTEGTMNSYAENTLIEFQCQLLGYSIACGQVNEDIFRIVCQYMEFVIISDSNVILTRFSHSLSVLRLVFKHFISSDPLF